VHGLEKRPQRFTEGNVTGAAAETAGLLEISLGKTADRTFLSGATLLDFLGRSNAQQQIGESEAGRVLNSFFFRARIAQIHFLHLALENLRQEDRRVIAFANIAQHFSTLDLEMGKTFNSKPL
jgi:hypothetical protein